MAKNPYFPFYTQDFLVGTMFMSDAEIGIYIKLLCIQHQHGGLIDTEVFEAQTKERPNVKSKFIKTEDGYFNQRLMDEIVKSTKKSTNLSANAKKRWKDAKQKISESNAIASNLQMPSESEIENEINIENNINSMWIKSFGRNPKMPEFEKTIDLIKQFGQDIIERSMKKAVLNGVTTFAFFYNNLDESGNFLDYRERKEKDDGPDYETGDQPQ